MAISATIMNAATGRPIQKMTFGRMPKPWTTFNLASGDLVQRALRAVGIIGDDDVSGAKLPAELGPWTVHQEAELAGVAADEPEALGLIRAHGFCCFRSEPAC